MTEEEWLGCEDPEAMLSEFRGRFLQSGRKLRLLGVAACRRIWHLLEPKRRRYWHLSRDRGSQLAVEVAEKFAEGEGTQAELQAAYEAASRSHHEAFFEKGKILSSAEWAAELVADPKAFFAATRACNFAWWAKDADLSERVAQARLVRDIFGNPYRVVAMKTDWLAWNDGAIPKLAQTIYGNRRFTDLPILADALEEAGCTDAAILEHCRQPGEHVRGCWVVDLLLGKE